MITLYDKPECPFCWRVRLALVEINVTFRVVNYRQEPHCNIWPKLTPNSTVPVLVDENIVIYESAVIMEYLQDVFHGLLPDKADQRVKARLLSSYSDSVVGKAVREVIFEKRDRPESEWDLQRIDRGTYAWYEVLSYLSAQLQEQSYFAEHYSLTDMALTARFGLAHAYGLRIPEQYRNLQDWFRRMMERTGFELTAPPVVLDCMDSLQYTAEV